MADNVDSKHTHKSADKLRQRIRQERANLSSEQQIKAAEQLVNNSAAFAPLREARTIANYQAFQGEMSTDELIKHLKPDSLYLPRINSYSNSTMEFYPAEQPKVQNRYGIWEPAGVGDPIDLKKVDVVLVPLVAFDRLGNRMGMGAGFYDRALSFRLNEDQIKKPLLIGLAHALQEVTELSRQPWDVPLDAIITDQEFIEV